MNPLKVNEQFEHTHDLDFMAISSTSEELQKRRPRARVVKAFSTLPASILAVDKWEATATKPSIFLAGDDLCAKEIVRGLARDAGFEAFDAGPLRAARSIEQFGILLHNVWAHQFQGDYSRLAPTLVRAIK